MAAFGILVAVSSIIALVSLMAIARQASYNNEAQNLYLNYSYMQEVSALGLSASSCSAMNASMLANFYAALEASAKSDGLNASMQSNTITIYKDSYPNIFDVIECG
ncbi:MAG: hypothetical protein QXW10_04220 [Candidatus Micrarchaeaceae archaeon]